MVRRLPKPADGLVVVPYEFLMASSLVDGVILSVAVLQAERRICRYDIVCNGRSLGPLVKTRALRDDALRDSEFKLTRYRSLMAFLAENSAAIQCGKELAGRC